MLTNKTVQENTHKQTQYKSEKVGNLKYSSTLVQLTLTTLGQETRWAYSTTPPSPHGAPTYSECVGAFLCMPYKRHLSVDRIFSYIHLTKVAAKNIFL